MPTGHGLVYWRGKNDYGLPRNACDSSSEVLILILV